MQLESMRELCAILQRLADPDGGCPWDARQTVADLARTIGEEAGELVEAIQHGADDAVCEEAGDLLWNLLFLFHLAEREGRFDADAVIRHVAQKMIRRHPHVFGDVHAPTPEAAAHAYRAAKAAESKDASPSAPPSE